MSIRSMMTAALAAATLTFTAAPQTAQAQGGGDQFLGQLLIVGFNFCPRGWALADGQLLPIAQYTALFSLLGTTYGGDGRTTFGLPDMRGRVPIGFGNGPGLTPRSWGQRGGTETNVLNVTQLPSHTHSATSTATSTLSANGSPAGSTSPAGTALAATTSVPIYSRGGAPDTAMAANSVTTTVTTTIGNTGSGQAVNNMQPFLGMYYCIATQGIFPSRP